MDPQEEKPSAARREMVDTQLRRRGVDDPRVLAAMLAVPREAFVSPDQARHANDDRPLPIGYGQTISQPYIVGLTLRELHVAPGHRVLDVGAGSGYQTALLAKLAAHVYAVERLGALAERATATLATLGIQNVTLRAADGTLGWPQHAPFDRIVCGAAAPDVPAAWLDQLRDGGRIVAPVGRRESQTLLVIEKDGDHIRRRQICGVRFVPLIGQEGWPE